MKLTRFFTVLCLLCYGFNALAQIPKQHRLKFKNAKQLHQYFKYQNNFYSGGTGSYAKVYNPLTDTWTTNPGFVNIEFEHKVFKDIAQGYASAYNTLNAESLELAYDLWLKSITDDFTKYPSLTPGTPDYDAFITGYNQQLNNWNSVSGNPYHSAVNANLKPNAMLHLFNKKNKNCTP